MSEVFEPLEVVHVVSFNGTDNEWQVGRVKTASESKIIVGLGASMDELQIFMRSQEGVWVRVAPEGYTVPPTQLKKLGVHSHAATNEDPAVVEMRGRKFMDSLRKKRAKSPWMNGLLNPPR